MLDPLNVAGGLVFIGESEARAGKGKDLGSCICFSLLVMGPLVNWLWICLFFMVSVTVNQHTSEDSGHVRNLTLGPRLFMVEAEFITLVLI